MHKGRLEAFSDRMIAILITIMVLELKVPLGADLAALAPVGPVFLVYALSFVFLGIYWSNRHHMLQATKGQRQDPLGEPAPALLAFPDALRNGLDGGEPRGRPSHRGLRGRAVARGGRLHHSPGRDHRRPWPRLEARGGRSTRCEGEGLDARLRRRDPLAFVNPSFDRALRRRCPSVARAGPPDRIAAAAVARPRASPLAVTRLG